MMYKAVRIFTIVWMTAVLLAAFLLGIPRINILEHTARNLYFHVPMWFVLMFGALVAAYHSVRYLSNGRDVHDVRAEQAVWVALAFGLLGIVTGMVWARFTWYVGTGKWWNNDPKQVMAAVEVLIFAGYLVLRSSTDQPRRKGRLSAVYMLFATSTMPFLLYVLPRQMASLHPGAEGNPAFDEITHPVMRLVFYPAIIGFCSLFWWIYTQRTRTKLLEIRMENPVEGV